MRGRFGWLVVALFIAVPFLYAFVLGPTERFCAEAGVIPVGDRIKHDDNWFLVGEPVSSRSSCGGDDKDLIRLRGPYLTGIDAVVWANCEVTWVDGRRSTAEAEGLDRCT